MRVKIVGKGTVQGVKRGSDIMLMIVPEETPERSDHVPVYVCIDPETDPQAPELLLEIPDA